MNTPTPPIQPHQLFVDMLEQGKQLVENNDFHMSIESLNLMEESCENFLESIRQLYGAW